MNITERQRELIERAMDEAIAAPDDPKTIYLLDQALRIVREQPRGARRIRSDAGLPRRPHTIDPWACSGWDPR